jgi:hypothetical protein
MLRALTLLALAAFVVPRGDARLWETIAQTEARYGHALQKFSGEQRGEEQRKYRYKSFYILVTFVGGRSDDEMYFHTDGKTPFSDRDIQFFLNMTSGGKPWQKSSNLLVWTLGGSTVESWNALAAYFPKVPGTTIPGFGISTLARAKKTMQTP